MQQHRVIAKMGHVGEGYKVFYEVMTIFSVFHPHPPKEPCIVLPR